MIEKIIQRRSKISNLSDCVINKIIKHNREQPSDTISNIDIAGTFNLFFFAGTDTSFNISMMSICEMADKPDLKQYMRSICSEIYQKDGITLNHILESNDKLSMWTKEALRLHSAIQRGLQRYAVKDLQLHDVTIRKGDRVSILFAGLNFDKKVFTVPDTFVTDRFSAEKEKILPKYQHIPFSIGRRNCVGKHLGEMMVKLLVTQFVRKFEFSKPAGLTYENKCDISTVTTNPIVRVEKVL